jgi:hypothetical protein
MPRKKHAAPVPEVQPEIQPIDIHYDVNFDYDYVTNCDENQCDDYCRCGVYENLRFVDKSINLESIISNVMYACEEVRPKKYSDIDVYCVERILTTYDLYDTSYWSINAEGGYYGQEIRDITPTNQTNLNGTLKQFWALQNNKEKIEFILQLEYHRILDVLNDIDDYYIDNIAFDKLHIGNQPYFKKTNGDMYVGRTLPYGVCIKNKNDDSVKPYRLIDGYHRVASLKNTDKPFPMVIGVTNGDSDAQNPHT